MVLPALNKSYTANLYTPSKNDKGKVHTYNPHQRILPQDYSGFRPRLICPISVDFVTDFKCEHTLRVLQGDVGSIKSSAS